MLEKLKSGLAVLEVASVTPLCLCIRADGSWGYYKTVALAGHPSPGNAKHGFSHPTDIRAHRNSSSRVLGDIDPLPSDVEGATDAGKTIGEGLWPNEWTIWVSTRDSDGTVASIDICRRIRQDKVALVAAMISGASRQSINLMIRGGRP